MKIEIDTFRNDEWFVLGTKDIIFGKNWSCRKEYPRDTDIFVALADFKNVANELKIKANLDLAKTKTF